MSDSLGLSIGMTNLVAARIGRAPVMRRSVLTFFNDRAPEVGLPTENAERIFDAFQTTKPEGTGMGLAITRSIVEAHGGRVWATANQGPGATFHFTLPIEAETHG